MVENFSFVDVGINLPTFKDIENVGYDKIKAVAKFREHKSGWIWYVIAGESFDDGDVMLYCYVEGFFKEFGNVMLSTILESGAMFCPTFKPCYIKKLVD